MLCDPNGQLPASIHSLNPCEHPLTITPVLGGFLEELCCEQQQQQQVCGTISASSLQQNITKARKGFIMLAFTSGKGGTPQDCDLDQSLEQESRAEAGNQHS